MLQSATLGHLKVVDRKWLGIDKVSEVGRVRDAP